MLNLNAMSKLTLGELAKVEQLAGVAITDIGEPGVPMVKVMAAVAYVWRKRTDPEWTFEATLGLTMDELNGVLDGAAEPDPTIATD